MNTSTRPYLHTVLLVLMAASFVPDAQSQPDLPASPHADTTTVTPLPYYPDGVQTVTVEGRTITYVERAPEDVADAPVLLFVHGLGSNLSLWRDHVDAFPEHRVLALDLPGFGVSEKADVPATMPFFANAVAGFLDAMNAETVTYTGVSMGGQIGMHFALRHPDRLDRLVLVSPAGIETFSEKDAAAIKGMTSAEGIMASTDAQVQQSVALNFHEYTDDYAWLVEQRHALAARDDFPQYAEANARAVSGMLDGAVSDRLHEVDVPTLVLFGAGDKLIPNRFLHPDQSPETVAASAREAMPEARVERVDAAGHLLMIERPERFRELLRSALDASDE
jgi:pimeloyl-ACP methyl ester carboxylesterase